jgi:small-conductance mechanosensitive channel
MAKLPGGVPDFVPQVRYHALGDGVAKFTVVMRAKENNEASNVRHEFLKRIRRRYEKEGIVMPSAPVAVIERPRQA